MRFSNFLSISSYILARSSFPVIALRKSSSGSKICCSRIAVLAAPLTNEAIRQYDGVYNAKDDISAENTTIQSGTKVVFEAGNKILLKPGFHATAGI